MYLALQNEQLSNNMADVSMGDAHVAATGESGVDKIKNKIKALLTYDFGVEGTFKLDPIATTQLQSLHGAKLTKVILENNFGFDATGLDVYDVHVTKGSQFLQLACIPSKFYVRQGYDDLFQHVSRMWDGKEFHRVCLIGNAGTGKSWFQIYALKRLLMAAQNKEPKYDLVIRQVDTRFYLIDLQDIEVYIWDTSKNHVKTLCEMLQRTIYFFEPGDNQELPPLGVVVPSLSTLSPAEKRIHEYSKNFMSTLYFWPWTIGEMWTVICDAQLSISVDVLMDRYHHFGGILRNVLGEDPRAKDKLEERLQSIPVDILTSLALNIDRKEVGSNVSGYLLCYDNRLVEGDGRFSTKNLEFTSPCVEEAVANQLRTKSMNAKMEIVLQRLNRRTLDLSGKMLEAVAMNLLSRGSEFSWSSTEVVANDAYHPRKRPKNRVPGGENKRSSLMAGDGGHKFLTTKREVRFADNIRPLLSQVNLIVAPHSTLFPVVDFVFSRPDSDQPMIAFQCTWRKRHPFTVRALYDLRNHHLEIGMDQTLDIYIVAPAKEDMYAKRKKADFLIGSLDIELSFSKNIKPVSPKDLQRMWENTRIHVLYPNDSWTKYITQCLQNQKLTI
jgi:hypothetical protein